MVLLVHNTAYSFEIEYFFTLMPLIKWVNYWIFLTVDNSRCSSHAINGVEDVSVNGSAVSLDFEGTGPNDTNTNTDFRLVLLQLDPTTGSFVAIGSTLPCTPSNAGVLIQATQIVNAQANIFWVQMIKYISFIFSIFGLCMYLVKMTVNHFLTL